MWRRRRTAEGDMIPDPKAGRQTKRTATADGGAPGTREAVLQRLKRYQLVMVAFLEQQVDALGQEPSTGLDADPGLGSAADIDLLGE